MLEAEEPIGSAWLVEFPEVKRAIAEHCTVAALSEAKRSDLETIKKLTGNSVASALLYASARDAMQAFLIGGATDQALAALAEDCVRNACRGPAKDFFWKSKMEAKPETNDLPPLEPAVFNGDGLLQLPTCWETVCIRILPRAWTVDMYIRSFEPLDVSLDLYSVANTTSRNALARASALMETLTGEVHEGGDMADIDDDASNYKISSIAEMAHLIPEGMSLQRHDLVAYRLLCCLAEALNYSCTELTQAKEATAKDCASAAVVPESVDTPSEALTFSSPELDSHSSSSCSKGLMQCLRLLYAHSESCKKSEELTHGQLMPVQLPIGVVMTVESQDVSSSPDVTNAIEGTMETNTRLSFRPDASLKRRVKQVKEQHKYISESSSDAGDSDDADDSENDSQDGSEEDGSSSEEEEQFEISNSILSRILSVISSIAHLCGDDVGAHRCLSASIALDTGSHSEDRHSHDSKLKMACLLIEMHQFDEVQ